MVSLFPDVYRNHKIDLFFDSDTDRYLISVSNESEKDSYTYYVTREQYTEIDNKISIVDRAVSLYMAREAIKSQIG